MKCTGSQSSVEILQFRPLVLYYWLLQQITIFEFTYKHNSISDEIYIVKSITGHRPKLNVLTFARQRFKWITAKLLQYCTRQTVGFKQLWHPLVILNKSDKMKTTTVLPTADYWICLYWKHRDDEFYILSKSGFIKNQTVI